MFTFSVVVTTVHFIFSLFQSSFADSCDYYIYLREVDRSGFGWSNNSVTVKDYEAVVLDDFSAGSASFRVIQNHLMTVEFNNNESQEAAVNYYGVSFNGTTIYNSLPELAYIPNYCTDEDSCEYGIEIFNSDTVSWTGLNVGYLYFNDLQIVQVLQSDQNPSTTFYFSVRPGDVIQVRRPDNFAPRMKYVVYDQNLNPFYELENDGNGPPEWIELINFCGAESFDVTVSNLPAVIEPESAFDVAVILPNFNQETVVKLFVNCTNISSSGSLFSSLFNNSMEMNDTVSVTLSAGVFGTCEVYAISLNPGVNPFRRSLIQTVQIKYLVGLTADSSDISMLSLLRVLVSLPSGAPDTSAGVSLTCEKGWSQNWTDVSVNSPQDLLLNSPVPPNSICTLSTQFNGDMYINSSKNLRTLDSPFPVLPITPEQIEAFAHSIVIPPSKQIE